MQKLMFFIAALCLPIVATAQPFYEQKIYVFAVSGEPAEGDPQQECQAGLRWMERNANIGGIAPNFYSKYKISIVRTAKNGKVVDTAVNEIGTLLNCADYQSYFEERNIVPVYHEITLGKRKYRAVGAGTSDDFPEFDLLPGGSQWMVRERFPEGGVTFINTSATVLPARSLHKGGSLVMNNLGFIDGQPREYYNHATIGVLNVVLPLPID